MPRVVPAHVAVALHTHRKLPRAVGSPVRLDRRPRDHHLHDHGPPIGRRILPHDPPTFRRTPLRSLARPQADPYPVRGSLRLHGAPWSPASCRCPMMTCGTMGGKNESARRVTRRISSIK